MPPQKMLAARNLSGSFDAVRVNHVRAEVLHVLEHLLAVGAPKPHFSSFPDLPSSGSGCGTGSPRATMQLVLISRARGEEGLPAVAALVRARPFGGPLLGVVLHFVLAEPRLGLAYLATHPATELWTRYCVRCGDVALQPIGG